MIAIERNKTIVCVDDEPLVSRALYRLFSREPYDVLIADTARKALRYVQDYDVDLVITDQRMPDMSGVELLREVRQASPGTKSLILTAYPESVLVDDPPEAPIPPLFAKPWDEETLREGVREMLLEAPEGRPCGGSRRPNHPGPRGRLDRAGVDPGIAAPAAEIGSDPDPPAPSAARSGPPSGRLCLPGTDARGARQGGRRGERGCSLGGSRPSDCASRAPRRRGRDCAHRRPEAGMEAPSPEDPGRKDP